MAMAAGRRRQKLAICLLFAGLSSHANAQEQTAGIDVSPTTTPDTPTGDVSSPISVGSEPTTTDFPMELWGIANSLLSSYYPSTTITNVADLTWPSEPLSGSSTNTNSSAATSPIPPSTSAISPSISGIITSSTPSSTLATVPVSSHDVSRPMTTDTSTANEAEPSDSPEDSARYPKDRTLGIALGVVFGVLALAVMAFALICVHKRQKKHGGTGIFPSRRRRATSPTDSEVGAWRARHPHMSLVAPVTAPVSQMVHNRPPRDELIDRYNRLEDHQTPPVHMHPAFVHARNDSGGLSSETNPFFTPADRSIANASNHKNNYTAYRPGLERPAENGTRYNDQSKYHPGYPKSPGFDASVVLSSPYQPDARRSESSYRRSSSSSHSDAELNDRPPTPFSPMMMLQTSSPPQQQQQQPQQDPFTSHKDEDFAQRQRLTRPFSDVYQDEDDIVSPIQPPSKSPARRYSPLVHYPSWSEVSEFNFTEESQSQSAEWNARQQRSRSFGRDGYGRDRESVVGRTELA